MGGIGSGRRTKGSYQPLVVVPDRPRLPLAEWYEWVCRCGEPCRMTMESQKVFRRTHQTFYCVHGHPSHYPEGESAEDKLRRERDRLAQQIAQKDDEVKEAWAAVTAERKKGERERKRIKAGLCPCCNRTFANMARHMATKHPTFTPLEVIEGGKAVA